MESGTEKDVILGVTELLTVVVKHPEARTDGGLAVLPRVPSQAQPRSDAPVVFLADFFTERGLVARYPCRRMRKDVTVQRIEIRVAGADNLARCIQAGVQPAGVTGHKSQIGRAHV